MAFTIRMPSRLYFLRCFIIITSLRQEETREESALRTASVRSQVYSRRYGEETVRHFQKRKTGNNKTAPESINESEEEEEEEKTEE